MYYVSYIEEYPIYEPAEGGYYYPGENVIDTRECNTWRKARKIFNEWRKWFEEEFKEQGGEISRYDCGGCDKYGDGSMIRWDGKYIGDGAYVQVTRKMPQDKGREPYC